MATPALHRLREAMPGAWIGAVVRPGIDQLLGSDEQAASLFDEIHIERPRGVMGHKHTATRLRQRCYDAALLLTNSFSTALSVRMAGVSRRVGYDRDGRGFLLTERLRAPKRPGGAWAIVPAVDYYWHAVSSFLGERSVLTGSNEQGDHRLPDGAILRLPISAEDRESADELLARAGVEEPFAILNPGGNNPAKRWPAERFIELGRWLGEKHGLRVLVNGSPNEAELVQSIASDIPGGVSLPEAGGTLGGLKALVDQAAIMITNDTGPRHFAVARSTPVVTLFGPTDHRWTSVPAPGGEEILVADPSLPSSESANDHPTRCAVDRITSERVIEAAERLLSRGIAAAG